MELSTILIPVAKEGTSCEYHRVVLPFREMGLRLNPFPSYDSIFFFNRTANIPEKARFILDLDDYWVLPPENPHKYEWDRRGVGKAIVENIQKALAVTVTNEQLADKVKEYNRNVHILPNALPFDEGQFCRTTPDFSKLVFAGGRSHVEDIKLIKDLPVHYYGGLNWSTALPLEWYMRAYDRKGVSLVPLISNEFNMCKSNLKVLEAGAKGLACVCSKTLPYFNKKDEKYVIYTEDFRETIKNTSREELQEKAQQLSEHVRAEYNLATVNEQRKQILTHYCEKG